MKGVWLVLCVCMSSFYMSSALSFEVVLADARFAECVKALAQKKHWKTVNDVTEINCNNKKITSIEGIEQFKNLAVLSLYKNKIKKATISSLPLLTSLNLARNELIHINVHELPLLETMYVFGNKLTALELTNLANLKVIKANSNLLETVTFKNTTNLEKIYIFDNKLETVDIYGLPNMKMMDCRQNPMPDPLYEEMDKMTAVTFFHDGNADDW